MTAEDIKALLKAKNDLIDELDRFKVSFRIDKVLVEQAKSDINHVFNRAIGIGQERPNYSQEDIDRAIHFIKELGSGKRRCLIFFRLADGTIIEEQTGITLRPI